MQAINAFAHGGLGVTAVGEAADPHHVAALLVIGIRVEQIVGNVFQNGLDGAAGHLTEGGVGVGDGGHVHQPFARDRLPGQQAGAPAKTR